MKPEVKVLDLTDLEDQATFEKHLEDERAYQVLGSNNEHIYVMTVKQVKPKIQPAKLQAK